MKNQPWLDWLDWLTNYHFCSLKFFTGITSPPQCQCPAQCREENSFEIWDPNMLTSQFVSCIVLFCVNSSTWHLRTGPGRARDLKFRLMIVHCNCNVIVLSPEPEPSYSSAFEFTSACLFAIHSVTLWHCESQGRPGLQDKIADAGGYGKEVRRPSCLWTLNLAQFHSKIPWFPLGILIWVIELKLCW